MQHADNDNAVPLAGNDQKRHLRSFHTDGYLVLPSLLTSPAFLTALHTECLAIFNAVLTHLVSVGAVPFAESCRPVTTTSSSLQQTEERQSDDNNNGGYEYPMEVGLKNGYRELVMRAPGRYELALLIDDEHSSHGRSESRNAEAEDHCYYYNGKRLMTVDMIERATRRFCAAAGNAKESEHKICICSESESPSKPSSSCLKQLLTWIKQHEENEINNHTADGENDMQQNEGESSRNDGCCNEINESTTREREREQTEADENIELVSAIFPSSSTGTTAETSVEASTAACSHDNTTTQTKNNKNNKNNNHYYLCNLSLILSTPGSPTQPWHSDGPHTSLHQHHPCHVFNLFIPLVDVPLSMGPTELRPGSHVYTRDLTRLMLLAKVKKRLRDVVVPELRRGDGLVFDYRILHRGRANLSHLEEDLSECEEDYGYECMEEVKSEEGVSNGTRINNKGKDYCKRKRRRGSDRPVLALTFARSWFVDVCNFPKRSIFSMQVQGAGCRGGMKV